MEEKIAKYENEEGIENLTKYDRDIYERTVGDLNELKDEKMRGVLFRSKMNWHNEGEAINKYFLNLERAKSGAKGMCSIITDSGKEIRHPKEILHKQQAFYKKLYTAEDLAPFEYINTENITVNAETKEKMEGKISLYEIKQAVKEMKHNKSPGLDGLTAEFYCVFLCKFEQILLEAINYAFTTSGCLHKSAMRGVITLIPKKGRDIRKIQNLRPISLLPVDYKLVEKVLANRLKPALYEIINDDQKGFMKDRRITSNIRRILDLIEFTDHEDIPGLVISIDFLKCFDRIETSALINAMKYFQFGNDFIKWTEIIYRNSQACVINNGYLSKSFQITRGVKQGGPCSAYYFLIIAEILAIEIRKDKNVKGICIDDITKTLGQYADHLDMYLFGEEKNLKQALNVIEIFAKKTGFKINYDKTTIYTELVL